MRDTNGDIKFEKRAKYLLPKFDEGDYFECFAAWLSNYILHQIRSQNYNPLYNNPENKKYILGNHVARMFGVQHARMFRSSPSVTDTIDTRQLINENEIPFATESLRKGTLQALHRCLHFNTD